MLVYNLSQLENRRVSDWVPAPFAIFLGFFSKKIAVFAAILQFFFENAIFLQFSFKKIAVFFVDSLTSMKKCYLFRYFGSKDSTFRVRCRFCCYLFRIFLEKDSNSHFRPLLIEGVYQFLDRKTASHLVRCEAVAFCTNCLETGCFLESVTMLHCGFRAFTSQLSSL